MPAPFRIEQTKGDDKLSEYLGKLIKLIPGPALGIYLTGKGLVPSTAVGWWALVGLVLVVVFRIWGTQDKKLAQNPQWVVVFVSAVSFIIWVYAVGDQIATVALSTPWIASVAVLVWTGLTPLFVKGA